ncbi:hypothetical protein GN244_ATG16448 [Phytophthora infestans]|uniref:Uncharacterized protein n=1 Tax=Phytophthora infestans TaxID=4787 RepID=A0A833SL54_PHYIN|nr:hypothetical protein GN244_ATG16448 [Phytophthora infestans]KAF4132306.1 hypothetical protein GN958_ATG18423 [Phytophthora infestans]
MPLAHEVDQKALILTDSAAGPAAARFIDVPQEQRHQRAPPRHNWGANNGPAYDRSDVPVLELSHQGQGEFRVREIR